MLLLLVLHEDTLLLEEQLLLLLLNAGRLRMLRWQTAGVFVIGRCCSRRSSLLLLLLLLRHRLCVQSDEIGSSWLSGRARVRSVGDTGFSKISQRLAE